MRRPVVQIREGAVEYIFNKMLYPFGSVADQSLYTRHHNVCFFSFVQHSRATTVLITASIIILNYNYNNLVSREYSALSRDGPTCMVHDYMAGRYINKVNYRLPPMGGCRYQILTAFTPYTLISEVNIENFRDMYWVNCWYRIQICW